MFGCVDHANAMGRVGEKGGPCLHRGQVATFALDPQILLDATLRGDQAHQRFGLMGVELIGDKDPSRLWIALDGLGDMGSEVGFGAGGSNAGCYNLAAGDIQIGDQRLGTMALVFEFLTFNVTGLHGQGGVETFSGLDAGHLIGAAHMGARRSKGWSGLIDLAHCADLLGQFGGIVGRRSEPIALAMGLSSDHLLKNAPLCGEKSARPCRV